MKWLKRKLRKWLGVEDLLVGVNTLSDQLHQSTLQTKKLASLVDIATDRIHESEQDIAASRRILNEYFRVDADVGYRGNNTIILTGIYRGRGYVQFYDVGEGEFRHAVDRMRDMHRCNLIRNVDSPYGFTDTFEL